MAKDVVMPVLGMTQDSGVLVRWFAQSGDEVVAGTPLMEVETDKAVVAVDAPASGVLADVTLAEGESVAVGTVIARIYAPSEAPARGAGTPTSEIATVPEPTEGGVPKGAVAGQAETAATTGSGEVATEGAVSQQRPVVRSSPLARSVAESLAVDLTLLSGRGSGPEGAVVVADVKAAAAKAAALVGQPLEAPQPSPPEAFTDGAGRESVTYAADLDLEPLRHLAVRLGDGGGGSADASDLLVLLVLVSLGGVLDEGSRVAVRRTRDGVVRRAVWSGERPVLAWLAGLDAASEDAEAESLMAQATVIDATSSRVRRRGGRGAQRLVVALGEGRGGGATIDVSADERDAALVERLLHDLVQVIEDPALAPFVLR